LVYDICVRQIWGSSLTNLKHKKFLRAIKYIKVYDCTNMCTLLYESTHRVAFPVSFRIYRKALKCKSDVLLEYVHNATLFRCMYAKIYGWSKWFYVWHVIGTWNPNDVVCQCITLLQQICTSLMDNMAAFNYYTLQCIIVMFVKKVKFIVQVFTNEDTIFNVVFSQF